jgi:cellulose synthase/poly-beta-1,6-N-acetylglucosamine synthase-like glycosyltransferase
MNAVTVAVVISFWLCLTVVCFTYVGYPVLVWLLARCFGRSPVCPTLPDAELPAVSLLIAAHNEAAVIEERIRNALAMDYPRDRLEIVVAADGCTDNTPEIVRGHEGDRVRLLNYPERRGKASALNLAFPNLRGDIILLSDANTSIDRTALRYLVRWFRDPKVGVVCGRLMLTDPQSGRNADSLYWKYESFLKRCEGRLGALLGSNGGIYAIRRNVFRPIPGQTILDDFVIPLQAKLNTGCSILYDSESIGREETAPDVLSEFRRRCRIGAGGFQSIGLLWKLLYPWRGWVALSFLAHKIFRWLCPFFMIGLVLSSLALVAEPFYRGAMASQLGFYLASVLATLVPPRFKSLKLLRLTTMFTSMNVALLLGFLRWLLGPQNGTWERTVRLAEIAEAKSG